MRTEYAYRDQEQLNLGVFAVNTRKRRCGVCQYACLRKCSFTGNFSSDTRHWFIILSFVYLRDLFTKITRPRKRASIPYVIRNIALRNLLKFWKKNRYKKRLRNDCDLSIYISERNFCSYQYRIFSYNFFCKFLILIIRKKQIILIIIIVP